MFSDCVRIHRDLRKPASVVDQTVEKEGRYVRTPNILFGVQVGRGMLACTSRNWNVSFFKDREDSLFFSAHCFSLLVVLIVAFATVGEHGTRFLRGASSFDFVLKPRRNQHTTLLY